MLFASLINHLAVQQIREPHGNLISHGKGEEEENSGGKKRAASGRGTLFYSPFFSSGAVEQGVWGLNGRSVVFSFFFSDWALTYPTNALLSLEHASVPVSL